mgnify:CR=1 FL=1
MYKKMFFMLVISAIFAAGFALAAQPYGANYTEINSTTAPADQPQGIPAQAGNVTELNIFGYTTTQSWQGYFGNVSGTIQLADAQDKVMYNWSQTSAQGEVYVANQSSVSWSNIECFNFTSTTELNITQLESAFNINSDDVDGIDETFNLNDHPEFYVGTTKFTAGKCNNTKLYDENGAGTFYEVLLYDSSTKIPVYAAILSDDTTGFDGKTHDFELIVPEDGHNGDNSVTTYYFYLELNA